MAFFDQSFGNNLRTRCDSIMANSFLKRNKITGKFEEIGESGGGVPGELPYYLKTNSIELDLENQGTIIEPT